MTAKAKENSLGKKYGPRFHSRQAVHLSKGYLSFVKEETRVLIKSFTGYAQVGWCEKYLIKHNRMIESM